MSTPPTSVELWTVAKVIGRECAAVNKAFFNCKKTKGADPSACEAESALSSLCAIKTVSTSKKEFPNEFKAFAECLDYNDFRYNDCRETEKNFLDCWNKKNGAI
jgi:hypothetical protein